MPRPTAPRPKWPIARLADIGNAALALAVEFRAELEPRLDPGLIDHLRANLVAFDGSRSDATNAPAALKVATRTQDAAAKAGYELVAGVRRAIARAPGVSKADHKAFGVGEKIRIGSVPQVLAGLDAIVRSTTERPAIARAAGILPADIEGARAIRLRLAGADGVQATIKETKKSSIASRNALASSISSDVDAVLAAASVAFYARPEVGARFGALVPGKGRKAPPPTPPS